MRFNVSKLRADATTLRQAKASLDNGILSSGIMRDGSFVMCVSELCICVPFPHIPTTDHMFPMELMFYP